MKGKRFVLVLCAALLMSGTGGWIRPMPALADERDVADVKVFDEPLARHGTWINVEEHGRVWTPRGVSRDWRPYTDGRWVYSDVGWTWVSNASWGWAPFHYGRWSQHASHGWYWVPGTTWGPAWVSWRRSPGWVGWAPLPPRVSFDARVGLNAAHMGVDIAPNWFSFVPDRHILAPRIRTYMASPRRNVQLVRVTKNVTNYTVINNRIVNRSIDVKHIERVTRRPVVVHRIVEDDAEKARGPRVRGQEREVVIGRPVAARERRDDNEQERREQRQGRQPQDNNDRARREPQGQGQEPARERRDERRNERGEQQQQRENLSQERTALEERQRQEQQNRPDTVSAEELRQRHEVERKALESRPGGQQQDLRRQAPDQRREEPAGTAMERRRRDRQELQKETARERQQTPSSRASEDTERRAQRQRQQAREEQRERQSPPEAPEQRGENAGKRDSAVTDPSGRERPARPQALSPEERRERRQAIQQRAREEASPRQPQGGKRKQQPQEQQQPEENPQSTPPTNSRQ